MLNTFFLIGLPIATGSRNRFVACTAFRFGWLWVMRGTFAHPEIILPTKQLRHTVKNPLGTQNLVPKPPFL